MVSSIGRGMKSKLTVYSKMEQTAFHSLMRDIKWGLEISGLIFFHIPYYSRVLATIMVFELGKII